VSNDVNAAQIVDHGEMTPPEEMGGDPACWLHLFCSDCGVQLDGTAHYSGCSMQVPHDPTP
jgi:hypothetical protein